jgi:hypothetical protein
VGRRIASSTSLVNYREMARTRSVRMPSAV